MASRIQSAINKNLIQPPKFIGHSICYEVITGSVAYGISTDTSDEDIYSFCVPPKAFVFPHSVGIIPNFGRQKKEFDQYQQHGINDTESGKKYDFTVFNIVKFFNLCMDCNPNMIDTLFVPRNCVTYTNAIGELVRDNRRDFLHKGCFHRYRGYAYAQMHKIEIKTPEPGCKREEIIKQFGFDVKFATHAIRLLLQCEDILINNDLDLLKNKEILKAIRRGEVPLEDIKKIFSDKEKHLENLYNTSKLPNYPDEDKIKGILLNCLEQFYGSLSSADIVIPNKELNVIQEIQQILNKYGY